MPERVYPYDLSFVQSAASGLAPVIVHAANDLYMLAIGLTRRCNFKCPICYYHGSICNGAEYDMPLELLESILASLPILARIVVGLEGEPFLHRNFFEALEVMAARSRNLVIITNGSLLHGENRQRLADFPISHIMVSMDAADAHHYARFRPGGKYASIRENIVACVDSGFSVLLHATVFRENLLTLLDLPRLAMELGVSHVSFQQMREHDGSKARGVNAASVHELKHWLKSILEEAQRHHITLMPDRFFGGGTLRTTLQHMAHLYPDNVVYENCTDGCPHVETLACILADGSLFPCAGDYTPAPLTEYSFDAIFNHPYLQLLRALHKHGRISSACAVCMNNQG